MGLFDFLKRKNEDSQSNIPLTNGTETGVMPKRTGAINNIQSLPIHPDILDLIWIGDGPKKNYIQKSTDKSIVIDGIKITINFSSQDEPSLLSVKMPVSFDGIADGLPYYPSYRNLTPCQRGQYWRFLANPYDSSIEIGYVFILYYGLERFMLTDKYEQCIDVILKLRAVHSNHSFQSYSSCAIVLTCILYKRQDILVKFLESINMNCDFPIDEDLYLLSKYYLKLPITSKDIIRMTRRFQFKKTYYIKKYPELFEQILFGNIKECHQENGIILNQFITKNELKKLPYSVVPIFANMSIDCSIIEMPNITESAKLKNIVNDLLYKTHEDVKNYMAYMRKSKTVIKKSE